MGRGSENHSDEVMSASSESTTIVAGNKSTFYDWEEIRKHNKKDDMWLVVNDNVYDVTRFRRRHPGGERLLDHYAGQDATVSSIPQNTNF
jgi:cytochrome b involved in lipid metabolism